MYFPLHDAWASIYPLVIYTASTTAAIFVKFKHKITYKREQKYTLKYQGTDLRSCLFFEFHIALFLNSLLPSKRNVTLKIISCILQL
jgi:hypothetical protein